MSEYNNMNVELEDDEPLETDIDNNTVQIEEKTEDDGTESDGETAVSSNETQLAGMLVVVWVLLIIGVIVFVAGTIIKKRQASETQTIYVNVASGMYTLAELTAEEQSWTDYLIVEKKVQTNGNTVAFYLSGKADNYGKIVYIPVNQEEFNGVNNGDKIEFVFSRLNIENKENIMIRRWSIYDDDQKN